MQTYGEMQSELVSRLQVANNSTLFPTSRIQTLIKDAHLWATSLYIWLDLVRAKTTSTRSGHEYYDYPTEFRTDTIVMIEIDGEEYDRKNFEDFRDYRRNNATSKKKIYSNYGRQFFISPIPTVDGSNNMDVWGAIQAPQLTLSTDYTIFSRNNDSGNEAIVKKAQAVAVEPKDPNKAAKLETDAIGLLTLIFQKQQNTLQRDQRIQHPQFDVPDFFAGNGMSVRPGSFSLDPDSSPE